MTFEAPQTKELAHLKTQSQIGIVGLPGSGKTSLIAAINRTINNLPQSDRRFDAAFMKGPFNFINRDFPPLSREDLSTRNSPNVPTMCAILDNVTITKKGNPPLVFTHDINIYDAPGELCALSATHLDPGGWPRFENEQPQAAEYLKQLEKSNTIIVALPDQNFYLPKLSPQQEDGITAQDHLNYLQVVSSFVSKRPWIKLVVALTKTDHHASIQRKPEELFEIIFKGVGRQVLDRVKQQCPNFDVISTSSAGVFYRNGKLNGAESNYTPTSHNEGHVLHPDKWKPLGMQDVLLHVKREELKAMDKAVAEKGIFGLLLKKQLKSIYTA